MAITDAYATAAEYRTGISPAKTDTSVDGEILNDLTAVSRYIERKLGQFFTKDASAVDRDFWPPLSGPVYPESENPWKYAGKAAKILHLDVPLVSVTTLKTDENGDGTPETTWAATDYQLLPMNADKGPEARPYTAIAIPSWSTQTGWPAGRLVRINGVFGWPAIPAAVKRSVIQLTALLRLETPRATATVNDVGETLEMSGDARNIIRELSRVYTRSSV